MELEEKIKKALEELRKEKPRKFDQTVELIINLQKFDHRKTPLNFFIRLPHKIKEKKIAAFLETKNKKVDTITPSEFKNYSEKKEAKKLVKKYDFFISQANLMPKIATVFGRVLGPQGKMPSPQLGILTIVNDKEIEELKEKINHTLRIKVKEASIKMGVGKQSMKDSELIENIITAYNEVLKNLPRGKENVKNLKIKFTMTKPQKISIR